MSLKAVLSKRPRLGAVAAQSQANEEESMSTPAVNSVTLVGNLTADPQLSRTPDGKSVCDLRLAVNDQQGKPLFVDVSTFGPSAQACAEHLVKGRSVAVIGRLTYRQWKAKDGTKRSRHQVVGRVVFGSKEEVTGNAAGSEGGDDDE
jgi:single-strand DNA-binding protein